MAEYYRYEKYQKYINGVPADPPEYKQGELIGTGEYDSLSDCESDAIYRWVDNGETVCKEYSLYNQEKKQKSTDNGVTWTDTGEVRDGNKMIEQYAEECGWRLLTRWEKTGRTVCDGGALTEEYIKQESWDMGKTWQNCVPEEYKYELLDEWSKECVLQLDPIVLEVSDGTPVAGGYEYQLPLSMVYNYNFWTQWEENGIIYDHEIDGDNAYSYVYPNKDPHIVKVWGWATELFDREYPYSVISWGSYYGTTYNRARGTISIPYIPLLDTEEGRVFSTSFYSDKAATQFARINVGENLVSWVDDTNNILRDNREFRVHNSHITKLPVSTFDNMNTYILDVSDCTNLVEIPPLQEGTERYFGGWHSLRAKNCVSLTKVPDGLYEHYSYRYDFGADNTREDIIPEYYFGMFNCIEAFKGCTKITELPDKLDITFSRNMFQGCTGLTDISNCTITTSLSAYMFNGCVNITTMPTINSAFKVLDKSTVGHAVRLCAFDLTLGEEPDINLGGNPYTKVDRSNMFCTTKVTSVNLFKIDYTDPDIPEDFKQYRVGICDRNPSYFEMFKDCPITTLEGQFKKIQHYRDHDREVYKPSGCRRMFYNTQLTQIPELFSELETIPGCSEMFANCNITSISNNFFNYNLRDEDKYNTVEDFLQYMFAGNKLTNYPIQNDLPIWRWPNLYQNNSYITTYAFFNNIEIGEQVPLEWGGFGGIKPVIIETDAESITINPGTNGLFRVLSDGVLYKGTQTITLPEGTNTIYIYVPDDTTWKVTSAYYKILDFGGGGKIDVYSDPNYITYLGTDQGVFKATTKFPLDRLKNVKGVSEDFLKSGTNINSVEHLFTYNDYLTSLPEGLFSKLTNLSGADRVFQYSNIENVDGMFEGCANLISAYAAFDECPNLISAQRTFKDCTSLSNINYVFGVNPQYHPLAVNCNQLFENTAVTGFSPNMSYFLKLTSAIGMFRSCSKMTRANCTFTLVGKNVDLTEMFKDCPLLNNNENQIVFVISEGSTANFTRCWQNCAVLSYIPKVQYAGNTVNPWEVPNAVGTECFNGCTSLLEKYGDQIPDGWK